MKFVIAVVMLACAFAAVQSSVIGVPGVSVWGSPWGGVWGGPPAAVAVHASNPWGISGPAAWGGIPGISLAQGPIGPAAIAAPLGHRLLGHEGVYVAKTRGAVHTAPLAGHINSATSLNLAPAPGTL